MGGEGVFLDAAQMVDAKLGAVRQLFQRPASAKTQLTNAIAHCDRFAQPRGPMPLNLDPG